MRREAGKLVIREKQDKSPGWLNNVSASVVRVITGGKSRKQLIQEGNNKIITLLDENIADYRERIERCGEIKSLSGNTGWQDIRVMLQRMLDERRDSLPDKMVRSFVQSDLSAVLDAIEYKVLTAWMAAIDDGIKKAAQGEDEAKKRYDAALALYDPEGN